jgi:ABC-type maltose transport system permease subunit
MPDLLILGLLHVIDIFPKLFLIIIGAYVIYSVWLVTFHKFIETLTYSLER